MAEIILAIILVFAAIGAALVALLTIGANAIGGVTAPDRVNHSLTIIAGIVSLACLGGAVWLLVF